VAAEMKVGDLVKDVCGDLGIIIKDKAHGVFYHVLWTKGHRSITHHYHLELICESR